MEYSSKIERVMDLILMLGLNETINQLAMAKSARFISSRVEERGWSCLEKCIRF